MRSFGVPAHDNATRTSLIAPSTLLSSVSLTLSAPTGCLRTRLLADERSRQVDELRPRVQACPSGRMPATSGKRAVVGVARLHPAATRLESGQYWEQTADLP